MASPMKNVTVVDSGAFDCGICESPLKPPIFQCELGHLVCSDCSEKMAAAVTCHVCRRSLSGGYKRCYGAEHIVEAFQVPCPNKNYGCSVMLPRYHESTHLQACQYRPFHCPGEDCPFITASLRSLGGHFVGAHGWPTTPVYDDMAILALVDGFNLVKPYRFYQPLHTDTETGGLGKFVPRLSELVLLKVTPESCGRVVTPIYIRRRNAAACQMKLVYKTLCGTHHLQYALNLASTDLSAFGGLLSSSFDDCFGFVVPKSVEPLNLTLSR